MDRRLFTRRLLEAAADARDFAQRIRAQNPQLRMHPNPAATRTPV